MKEIGISGNIKNAKIDPVGELMEKKRIEDTIIRYYKRSKNVKDLQLCCNMLSRSTKDIVLLNYIKYLKKKYERKILRRQSKTQNKKNENSKLFALTPKRRHFPRSLAMHMTSEERHERNGDKSTRKGYSSTGVKLPSLDDMKEFHKYHESHRRKYKVKRSGCSHVFINTPMGGQNKQY